MLRLKRMSPQGWASARNARSSPTSSGPAKPVMKARLIRAGLARAQRKGQAQAEPVMPALVAGIHVLRNAGGLTRRGWPGQPSRLMAARPAMTRGLVLLHDALAAGGLEAAAHLGSVVLGRERPDLGAVVHALV